MKKYKDSATALVADVDCTADGKDLCETHGVEGFPTIKWGDPSALEDYDGGREYEDLETFAAENLKPMGSPKNLDLCDADKQAEIEKKEAELKEAETTFEEEVQKLQTRYEELEKAKTEAQKAVKESGLGLMKAVKAAKGSKEEL